MRNIEASAMISHTNCSKVSDGNLAIAELVFLAGLNLSASHVGQGGLCDASDEQNQQVRCMLKQ